MSYQNFKDRQKNIEEKHVPTTTNTVLLSTHNEIIINLTEFNEQSGVGYFGEPNKKWHIKCPCVIDWSDRRERLVYSNLKKYNPVLFEIAEVTYIQFFDQLDALKRIRSQGGYDHNTLKVYHIDATYAPDGLTESQRAEQSDLFFKGHSDKPAF
jgi:hypothetical protein